MTKKEDRVSKPASDSKKKSYRPSSAPVPPPKGEAPKAEPPKSGVKT